MDAPPTERGPFLRHCPCSPGAVSCGYWNLDLQSGCPYDCSYCILQAYLPDKRPRFRGDWSGLERELREFTARRDRVRIGTGELSDSLAWDDRTGTAARLCRLFSRFPRAVLELKTKSDRIAGLLELPRAPANVVVSWSLNPAPAIAREEHGAPPLAARLAALAAVQAKGFRVAVHFDPLLLFPGWKRHYAGLVRELARKLDPGRVAWWSLGALRFPPALRPHLFRHGGSRLFWGELVPGFDGKYRYLRPLRLELFRHLRAHIAREVSRDIPLYLCMEDEAMWAEVFPGLPASEGEINRRLYDSLF